MSASKPASCQTCGQSLPRSLEALVLAAQGFDAREIANRMLVSRRAVHLSLWRAKNLLGARNRAEAIDLVRSRGLIPPAEGEADHV